MLKLSILLIGIFLAVTLSGCHDPVATERETEHQALMNIAEQHLQQGLCAYPTARQTQVLYPAP
ncbi:MAG: hypothetical protein JW837_14195 [Sedimentisphaerales bacterium]|nr:hypothetical protein [Sedimentisphaerales bacterium]